MARPQLVVPVGVGVLDLEGNTTWTDDVFSRSLGYSHEEFAAMPFTAYSHPDELEATLGRFAQLANGEIDHYAIERRFIRKDGDTLWGALSVSLVPVSYTHLTLPTKR